MKKFDLRSFLFGTLISSLVFSAVVTASATFGTVEFNRINLTKNGESVFEKEKNFRLPSGQEVPSSISYVDETGGGTTYLPVRRISELFDVSINWDHETGTVILGNNYTSVSPDIFLQEIAELWLVDGDYPKNEKGETYGPEILSEILGYMPDLIAAAATNGQDGYVRNTDLNELFSSSETQKSSIPVYDLSGNVIGEFAFEDGPSWPE